MDHSPLYRILLLVGACLLFAGILLPLFPFNGLIVIVALVCICIGYVLYPIHSLQERLLQICIGIVFILLILTYFYTPQWMPRAILDMTQPLLRIFQIVALGIGAYVWYQRSRKTNH